MRRALITGASSGLGRAMAERFLAAGWELILTGRCEDNIPTKPGITVIPGDIRVVSTQDALVSAAENGGLNALIHCAGVREADAFGDLRVTSAYEMLETNLIAPIELTKRLWHVFEQQKGGAVIGIGSLAGQAPGPGEAVYAASKAGMEGFIKGLQFDAVMVGVRAVYVSLGAMRTRMTKDRHNWDMLIRPEDVAEVVLDLCLQPKSLRISEITLNRSAY